MNNYISQETFTLLMLSKIKGVGTKKLLSLFSMPNMGELVFEDLARNLTKDNRNGSKAIKEESLHFAETQVAEAKNRNHRIISIFDHEYPSHLKLLPDAPPILFVAGDIELLNKKTVAVIGTRDPTEHGKIICERLTKWLVENNWIIVSGLAKGIDSISHKTCIENQGRTVAVLAHGLEKIYPSENRNLADAILASGGAILSEYPYNSFTGKSNFVKRDSTQAGLSSCVFLVQTGVNGGSLHASRAILKYGRPLVVVGQSKTDESKRPENAEGNLILLNGSYNDVVNIIGFNYKESLFLKMKNKDDFSKINESIMCFSNPDVIVSPGNYKLL
ncbi:DNA-processing protein DprA [Pseudaeromonas sp. ZJS20]|uniref:DNA-processing protein DprA n=1 Tax=Pseudaeromonas aegiceratis TaxID=3153928 RepID=UPI00390CC1D2